MFIKVMKQHGHAGDDVNLNEGRVDHHLSNTFFLQGIIHNNICNALYILKYICIQICTKMNIKWHKNLYNALCQGPIA